MSDSEPLIQCTPVPMPRLLLDRQAPVSDEPNHKVLYLVHDTTMKDGRVGLGVFTSLDRARRACRASEGTAMVSIRPVLVDGAVSFAQDYV